MNATAAAPARCRGCGQERTRSYRRRGLCWGCYHSPARVSHPVLQLSGNAARAAAVDAEGHVPMPAGPTDAEPGSEAKIRAMAERYAARVQLHHPADRRITPPGQLALWRV